MARRMGRGGIWKHFDEFDGAPEYVRGPWWAIRGLYSRKGAFSPHPILCRNFNGSVVRVVVVVLDEINHGLGCHDGAGNMYHRVELPLAQDVCTSNEEIALSCIDCYDYLNHIN